VQLAREHLAAEVKRLRAWRQRTPARLETDIPDTPPTEWVSSLGDETLEFHEPDEDLKPEDVLADLDVAFLLHYVDGLSGSELAKA